MGTATDFGRKSVSFVSSLFATNSAACERITHNASLIGAIASLSCGLLSLVCVLFENDADPISFRADKLCFNFAQMVTHAGEHLPTFKLSRGTVTSQTDQLFAI